MAKKSQNVHTGTKNNGAEISINLTYLSHSESASLDKMRIEEWLRKETRLLLANFHITFPGV